MTEPTLELGECGHMFAFKLKDGVLFNWTNCQLCGAPPTSEQMEAMRGMPAPGGTYAPAVTQVPIPFGAMEAVAAAVDLSVPSEAPAQDLAPPVADPGPVPIVSVQTGPDPMEDSARAL